MMAFSWVRARSGVVPPGAVRPPGGFDAYFYPENGHVNKIFGDAPEAIPGAPRRRFTSPKCNIPAIRRTKKLIAKYAG